MKTYEGKRVSKDIKIGIVASRFNDFITSKLLEGAKDALIRHEVNEDDIEIIAERFHKLHEQTYGHAMREDPIEFVNYRVSAVGQLKKPNLLEVSQRKQWKTDSNTFSKKKGKAIFNGKEYNADIYHRDSLEEGVHIEGPAIIGEMGATVVIYPGQKATVDRLRNIIIQTGY